jgi:lipopolysaccharide/colanic/teichoic acid biosynthesis glycosyltransferase
MIRPSSKERAFRVGILVAGDFLIGWGSLLAVVALRRNVNLAFTKSLLPAYKFALDAPNVILFALSLVAALALSGFYNDRVTPRTRPSIITALVIQAALVAIGGIALARPLPRTVLLAVPIVEVIGVPLWRLFLRGVAPIRPRDTILIGNPEDIDEAMAGLRLIGDRRIRVICQIGIQIGVPDSASRERLRDAEEVICVSPNIDARMRLELLRIRGPRGFLMLASHADALLASRMLGWIGDQPLVEVGVSCGYGISAVVKRSIDVVGSMVLMIISAPLSIIAAIAIRLDDGGPVLIRQMRVGLGGEPYGMWKFRSMANERITRVGALLRPYHLDELPQLLNVFTGDMSLVGPRPERPELVAEILRDVPDFDLRCLVRPGIAGLAQVSAEYETRPEVKLRYDLMYMCDWSVWLDFRLLLRAVSTSLAGTGR